MKEAEYLKEEKRHQHKESSWIITFLPKLTNTHFPLESRDLELLWEAENVRKHSWNDRTKTQWVDKGFWKAVILTQGGQVRIVL